MRELYQQKILIVDDEPINISAIAEILGQKYALSVANNGEKALRILSEGLRPDLILLDILMPDIDGFEVAKQLKANPDTAAIPIIFLTAKKDNESIATGFKVGAVDYLSKPFQKEELLLRIKNTLQIFNLRNALNNALTESQKYIKTIESQMALIDKNIIFSSTDIDGKITEVSNAFYKISGYRKEQLIGKMHRIVRHPDMKASFFDKLWNTITRNETWHGEIKNRKKDGTFYWLETMIYPKYDADGNKTGYTAISHDITDKKRVEELSMTDQLTQIHNRLYLTNSFVREIKRAKRYGFIFAVIMIDIDHFKEVNDTYGHDTGDFVLSAVAKILQSTIRETDILGRWGGEEFLILLPHTDIFEAEKLAEKLRQSVEGYSFDTVGRKTCSFGVSVFNLEEDDCKETLKRADKALYSAKNSGRNRVERLE
ncbi:diguanylate cyclase [uncultured Sulfuricurvum sp.]|uniref:diguanylate cyclase n=1 Tax=uncultured Sulfuricurvum sp. TaxID=430693 RepID=UPI002616A0E5|nr:diguanylate cyclase [uncultured Sulfuricurvum sp.]